jgi:hypothetical protein
MTFGSAITVCKNSKRFRILNLAGSVDPARRSQSFQQNLWIILLIVVRTAGEISHHGGPKRIADKTSTV